MKLDAERWAVLSGVGQKEEKRELNESVTMGMAGPGFAPMAQQVSAPESDSSDEDTDLARLRMVVREELETVLSELSAEKEMKKIDAIAQSRSVAATMGFSGPGFNSSSPTNNGVEADLKRGRPTAGLIRGPGF